MSWMDCVMAASSGLPSTRQCTVSRMISGGSAGLMMMMALPCLAPPTFSTAPAVVRVNSSMFLRVPGPTERLGPVAPISPEAPACAPPRRAAARRRGARELVDVLARARADRAAGDGGHDLAVGHGLHAADGVD